MRISNAVRAAVVALAVVIGLSAPAGAATINAVMTVDNSFSLYLSTSDEALGTLMGSGTEWSFTYNLSADLTAGTTHYLHVVAADIGTIAGFIGGFTLDDPSFEFANGTQELLTNATDWQISNVGFGQAYYTPDEIGLNGVSPWNARSGIPSQAKWIWSNMGKDIHVTRYFSTPIFYVPEPATAALLAAGLLASTLRRTRRGN